MLAGGNGCQEEVVLLGEWRRKEGDNRCGEAEAEAAGRQELHQDRER